MRWLGNSEAENLDCLWKWGRPATVREVVDDINTRRPAAYTTVMTVTSACAAAGPVPAAIAEIVAVARTPRRRPA